MPLIHKYNLCPSVTGTYRHAKSSPSNDKINKYSFFSEHRYVNIQCRLRALTCVPSLRKQKGFPVSLLVVKDIRSI